MSAMTDRIPHVIVRHVITTPERTRKVAEILVDIIDHANRLRQTSTPGDGRQR
jgi:hypothetical protein